LNLLKDEELAVKRAALLTLNSALHHQPSLITDRLDTEVLPVLYEVLNLKLERKVDLGPFKHVVDDGLPLRKAAFACMDTLLDTLPDRVDIPSFLPYLCAGMQDKEGDVQIVCHHILTKVCAEQPTALLSALAEVLAPLDKTIHKKPKGSQVGTELERAKDLIRSALRAASAMAAVSEVQKDRKFLDFVVKIQRKEELSAMFDAAKREHTVGA